MLAYCINSILSLFVVTIRYYVCSYLIYSPSRMNIISLNTHNISHIKLVSICVLFYAMIDRFQSISMKRLNFPCIYVACKVLEYGFDWAARFRPLCFSITLLTIFLVVYLAPRSDPLLDGTVIFAGIFTQHFSCYFSLSLCRCAFFHINDEPSQSNFFLLTYPYFMFILLHIQILSIHVLAQRLALCRRYGDFVASIYRPSGSSTAQARSTENRSTQIYVDGLMFARHIQHTYGSRITNNL